MGAPGTLVLLENGDYLAISGATVAEFGPNGAPVSSFTSSTPTATSLLTNTASMQSTGDVVVASSVIPPGIRRAEVARYEDIRLTFS